MPAGTIKLTHNSATVTGTGTVFTTELKPNDFVVAIVGGVTYTLGIKSIASATTLMLISNYGGPTTAGLAWTAVPNATLVGITAQVAADVAKAIRGLNLDKANWQQVLSGSGQVTVTQPDGSTYTGPAWSGIVTMLNGKLDKNDNVLKTVNGKSGGRISSALVVNGGLSTTSGRVQIDGRNTESNGNMTNGMVIKGADTSWDVFPQYFLASGLYHEFRIVQNSSTTFEARSNGACYAVSFNPTSDSKLKFNKLFIDSALMKSMSLKGMNYDINGDRRAGIIAQDAQKVLPVSVTTNNEPVVLEDGTILNKTLSVDYSAIAGIHAEALKELMPLMLEMIIDPQSAKTKLAAYISAINKSVDDANTTDMKMEWALLNPPLKAKEAEFFTAGEEV